MKNIYNALLFICTFFVYIKMVNSIILDPNNISTLVSENKFCNLGLFELLSFRISDEYVKDKKTELVPGGLK